MARKLSSSEQRYDAWGQDTWDTPEDDRRVDPFVEDGDRHAPAGVERGGDSVVGDSAKHPSPRLAERPATHCPTCGKPLVARLTCVACGDEEQAA